jgi:hypothetical protein
MITVDHHVFVMDQGTPPLLEIATELLPLPRDLVPFGHRFSLDEFTESYAHIKQCCVLETARSRAPI